MSNDLGNGIAQLTGRRQRRTRQPLPSRHPVTTTPADNAASDETASQANPAPPAPVSSPVDVAAPAVVAEPAQPTALTAETAAQYAAATPAEPSGSRVRSGPSAVKSIGGAALPKLEIDLNDATAHIVSPTQLSIPTSIVARFDKARAGASSHTALVIDALRATAEQLPALILNRRPGPKEGDLFPFRATAADADAETPMPLRIRPTRGELDIMEKLVTWANAVIAQQRPGAKKTNRSEMVAAALDAHLPAA